MRKGFIFCLVSSARPMHELLRPNLIDQQKAMENQFKGMSKVAFSYEEFKKTRGDLIKTINSSLTKEDKEFLLSIKHTKPNWSIYNFKDFPAVQWKLHNLKSLREKNPAKYQTLCKALEEMLK